MPRYCRGRSSRDVASRPSSPTTTGVSSSRRRAASASSRRYFQSSTSSSWMRTPAASFFALGAAPSAGAAAADLSFLRLRFFFSPAAGTSTSLPPERYRLRYSALDVMARRRRRTTRRDGEIRTPRAKAPSRGRWWSRGARARAPGRRSRRVRAGVRGRGVARGGVCGRASRAQRGHGRETSRARGGRRTFWATPTRRRLGREIHDALKHLARASAAPSARGDDV